MYNLSSYCVSTSDYELQHKGKGKVKLLKCSHIAFFSHRATRHCWPGLAELAYLLCFLQPSLHSFSLLSRVIFVPPFIIEHFPTYYLQFSQFWKEGITVPSFGWANCIPVFYNLSKVISDRARIWAQVCLVLSVLLFSIYLPLVLCGWI